MFVQIWVLGPHHLGPASSVATNFLLEGIGTGWGMGCGTPDSNINLHLALGALTPIRPGLHHVVREQALTTNYPNRFNHESIVAKLLRLLVVRGPGLITT